MIYVDDARTPAAVGQSAQVPPTPKTGEELTHPQEKRTGRHSGLICQREAERMTFTTVDLMAAPVEKAAVMLAQILDGKRLFTL
jgi:hypothetical protein